MTRVVPVETGGSGTTRGAPSQTGRDDSRTESESGGRVPSLGFGPS